MAGRTYRYFAGKATYAFGAGRGYADVTATALSVDAAGAGGGAVAHVRLSNPSPRPTDHVVTLFATRDQRGPDEPLRALIAFARVALPARGEQVVDLPLGVRAFTVVAVDGSRRVVPGKWRLRTTARPDGGALVHVEVDAQGHVTPGDPAPSDAAPAP